MNATFETILKSWKKKDYAPLYWLEGEEDYFIDKVIAHAETRAQAVQRLAAALRDFPVLGIETNIPFLVAILEDAAFQAGQVDTSFLDRETERLVAACTPSAVPAAARAVFDAISGGASDHAVASQAVDTWGAGHAGDASAGNPRDWDPWSAASGFASRRPS